MELCEELPVTNIVRIHRMGCLGYVPRIKNLQTDSVEKGKERKTEKRWLQAVEKENNSDRQKEVEKIL